MTLICGADARIARGCSDGRSRRCEHRLRRAPTLSHVEARLPVSRYDNWVTGVVFRCSLGFRAEQKQSDAAGYEIQTPAAPGRPPSAALARETTRISIRGAG